MPVVTTHATAQDEGLAARAALARIARTGGLFAVSHVVRGAIALAMSIVVARHLGPAIFGRWTLCLAWASMLTFMLDLGFGVLLTRDAAADRRSAGHLVANALAARTALFLPGAMLFVAFAPVVGLSHEATPVLVATLLLAATSIGYGTIAAVFRGWPELLAPVLALESAGAAVALAGAWQIVRQGGTVGSLLLLSAVVQTAQFVAAAILLRDIAGEGHRWRRPSIRASIVLLRRAFPFMVSGVVANVQERLALLMLGRLGGVADLASFGAAWRIGAAARMLPQAALGGGLPVLAEGATTSASHVVRSGFERWIGALALVCATIVALFAKPILELTYGGEFVSSASTLAWVGVGLWPFVVNSGRKVCLYADARERVAVRFSAVTLAIQVAACAALIPRFGAAGAAAGMAAGEAVVWWPLRRYARASS